MKTEEDNLCTALSLLLYGDCSLCEGISSNTKTSLNNQSETDELGCWMIDEQIPSSLEEASPSSSSIVPNSTLSASTLPTTGLFLRSFQPEPSQEIGQSQTLFLGPYTIQAPPLLSPSSKSNDADEKESSSRSDTPAPLAIFLRSDLSDDWIIA